MIFVFLGQISWSQNRSPFGEWTVRFGEFDFNAEPSDTLSLIPKVLESTEPKTPRAWKTISIEKSELVWTRGCVGYNPQTNEAFSNVSEISFDIKVKKRRRNYMILRAGNENFKLRMPPHGTGWLFVREKQASKHTLTTKSSEKQ